VVNPPPTAAFTFPTTCTAGTACSFDGSPSTDNGSIASWSWDFGDPNSTVDVSDLPAPSYTYSAPNTYTVTLTVTDNLGATNTVSHDVIVN
jgi:PKD repeat protein